MGIRWNPVVVSSGTMTDSRIRAIGGSVGFLLVGGPTIVAGLVPWLLTRWDADPQPLVLKILGVVLLLAGGALVLETTARFAFHGRGTPAPWAPPERFVERGSYRFVRSPMYLGVLLLVLGQALLLGREILFAWAVAAWLIFTAFLVLLRGAGATPPVRRVVRRLPAARPALDPYSSQKFSILTASPGPPGAADRDHLYALGAGPEAARRVLCDPDRVPRPELVDLVPHLDLDGALQDEEDLLLGLVRVAPGHRQVRRQPLVGQSDELRLERDAREAGLELG